MRTYFHLDMSKSFNMKASYFLETKERELLFEAKVIRQPFIKAGITEFINCRTGESVTRSISVPTEVADSDQPLCTDVDLTAEAEGWFKLDGVNCWDFLLDSGYTVLRHREGLKCYYTLLLDGREIGRLETSTWRKLFLDEEEEEGKGLLAQLTQGGFYRVDCEEDMLEDVFMICYCIAKANM